MHIYVASSWRNTYYPEVVQALRDAGHEVYDFIMELRKFGSKLEVLEPASLRKDFIDEIEDLRKLYTK